MSHEPPAGGAPDWYTPPEIFRALDLEFDLDPSAPALPRASWIPARRRISLPDDGLAATWEGRIWLNPPYGAETGKWVGKLAEHGDGVALVFVRTDTPWWQSAAVRASAICFVAGRVGYIDGRSSEDAGPRGHKGRAGQPGRAGAGSCLLAYGDECALALSLSRLGTVVVAERACVEAQVDLWSAAA